jgi:hypothetical protein
MVPDIRERHEMQASYSQSLLMGALSLAAMYLLMYAMVNSVANAY